MAPRPVGQPDDGHPAARPGRPPGRTRPALSPDLPLTALSLAAAASLALHLRAEYRGPRWQVYLFKPLTTALLLALAVAAPPSQGPGYRWAVMAGLALSWIGDVCLMLPGDRFVAGLGSFLVAHLAYLAAFAGGRPAASKPGVLVVVALVAVVVLRLLWPGLGRLRVPVVAYVAVIALMAWRALARGWELHSPAALLGAAGAALFMVSDALLALDRFRAPIPGAQARIMTTYVAAQWLIALSVSAPATALSRFVPGTSTAGPGALPAEGTCLVHRADPGDGTSLTLIRSSPTGQPSRLLGDYAVSPAGRHGVGSSRLVRVECPTGRGRGIVDAGN